VSLVLPGSQFETYCGVNLGIAAYCAGVAEISDAAAKHGRPIVCVSTDAPRMHRLASITADSFVSGGIAAELLGSWIADRGDVAVFTGELQVQDHADKLRGFAAMLATNAAHLTLLPAIESHESFDHAYKTTKAILAKHPHVRGLYVNTANCLPVLKAAAELGRFGQIRTVTTDLFPEMIPYIESGQVNASLYQRPFTQGKLAVETLIAFLARGINPQMNTSLAPHIVLRSNLPLFTERLDRARGGNSEF
jgi:LacI family transcriptional regulator